MKWQPPTDPRELLDFLRKEAGERRKGTKAIQWVAYGGFGLLLVLQLASWLVSGKTPDLGNLIPLLVLLGAASGVSTKHKLAAERASQLDRPEFAPMMVEILDCGEPQMKQLAEESLKRSLPQLRDEHRDLFDVRQQKLLATEAMTTTDVDLAEISLNALAGVGGTEVLSQLDLVGNGRHAVKGEPAGRVLTAAKMAASDIRLRTAARVIGEASIASQNQMDTEETRLDLHG